MMNEWADRAALETAAWTAVGALDEVAGNIREGVLLQEPEMNGAMASHLATAFNKARMPGLRWHGRHLKSLGPNTEENLVGADLILSLKIDLPDYHVEKGLLIQNKRDGHYNSAEGVRLLEQINKMAAYSSSRWVCVLLGSRFRFDSGSTIRARSGRFSHAEARIPAFPFFRDFFRSKTGDEDITIARAQELYRAADKKVDVVLVESGG